MTTVKRTESKALFTATMRWRPGKRSAVSSCVSEKDAGYIKDKLPKTAFIGGARTGGYGRVRIQLRMTFNGNRRPTTVTQKNYKSPRLATYCYAMNTVTTPRMQKLSNDGYGPAWTRRYNA